MAKEQIYIRGMFSPRVYENQVLLYFLGKARPEERSRIFIFRLDSLKINEKGSGIEIDGYNSRHFKFFASPEALELFKELKSVQDKFLSGKKSAHSSALDIAELFSSEEFGELTLELLG